MSSAEWAAEQWGQSVWEREQMEEARLPKEAQDVVRRLLNAWAAQTVPTAHLELALDTFNKLVRGQALVTPDDPSERWASVTSAGQVHSRDIVRVARDAYRDEAGRAHNGRRGRVLAVRYGDVVVRYEDGRQPPFDGVHHPPTRLERLIK